MRLRGLTYEELVILGNLGDRLADAELVKRENEGRQIRTGTSVRVDLSASDYDDVNDFPANLNGIEWPYDYADVRPELERAWDAV